MKNTETSEKILRRRNHLKPKVVYFVYLVEDRWEAIFVNQIEDFAKSGLRDTAEFYLSVTGTEKEVSRLLYLVHTRYPWLTTSNIFHENLFEFPGIKLVYEIAEDNDTPILYLHTKGIVSGQARARDLLSKYTVANFKVYIESMHLNPSIDVACAIPSMYGFSYFNFFWVRSSYIRNYLTRPESSPEYMKNGRFTWEMWLGNFNGYSRKHDIRTFSPVLGYCSVRDEIGALEVLKFLDLSDQLGITVTPDLLEEKMDAALLTGRVSFKEPLPLNYPGSNVPGQDK